jgi:3-oxoacyl-[acyl-carrier-protein] synthase-3
MTACITATGRFLPGDPVPNDEIEDYIGKAGLASSDLRGAVLANSGIKTRHYAINKNQQTLFSNTQMAAAAVREAVGRAGLGPNDVEMLAAATTAPDLMAPGHASMIHGELGYPPMEVMTAHGICSSGMMALKAAYHQVAIGEKRNAVAVASELVSRAFRSSRYLEMQSVMEQGTLPMETAFLRYMLSDGAGAAVIKPQPDPGKISLRIDWITLTSYANTVQACMCLGSNDNRCTKTWWDYPTAAAAAQDGALALRQKLSLLPRLVKVGVEEHQRLVAAGKFDPEKVTWYPIHYSSERMKDLIISEFKRRKIPQAERMNWFSNLTRVGNIGSASIYVILDEMLTDGLIKEGDSLLCMVPESGRFIISFMHLTAVSGPD